MPKAAKPKPQPTVVHVVVTTDGPVPMKAVREWVSSRLNETPKMVQFRLRNGEAVPVTSIRVKRDADVQRPQR